MASKVCIVVLAFVAMSNAAPFGGDGGHKHIKITVPYHVHTVHHHHVEKYPVYKKIEVPVVKEVKVPFPVHYPVKVPYPVIVKPHVVTVPVEHYPVHSTSHHYEKHSSGGSGESYGHEAPSFSSSGSGSYSSGSSGYSSGEGISAGYGGHQEYSAPQQSYSAPQQSYGAPSAQAYPYPPPAQGWMPVQNKW